MSTIIENLILSSVSEIRNRTFAVHKTSLNINAAEEVEIDIKIHAMVQLNLNWYDSPVQSINDNCMLFHLVKIIDAHIKNGKQVVVNCFAGISRSATIVIAYLMYKNKLSVQEAISFVRTKRPFINPNYGFVCQLYQLQDSLHNLDNIDYIYSFENKSCNQLSSEITELVETVPFIKEITNREITTFVDF